MNQPAGKLIVNLVGNEKSYYLWNGTESYYEKLRAAFKDIKEDKDSEYLLFGFFTLCAATLEYSLNFLIADFCVKNFGPINYKSYSEGYINISFRKKLFMLPHIVSNGEYKINETNKSFKVLEDLISLRNKILHNKEFLNEFSFPNIDAELHDGGIFVPLKNAEVEFEIEVKDNHIDSLTKDKCITYGNALGDFKKFIMTPILNSEIQENKMMLKS